jgi:hypothetical protein
MLLRIAIVAIGLVAAASASAQEMRAEEARRFVVGKLFSFTCFEGTSGVGRVHPDGSVSGVVRFGGSGPMRYVSLPAGTLRVRGETVCARTSGMAFETCFSLYRTDAHSFRGSLAGLGFASCHFTRRTGRADLNRTRVPRPGQPELTASDRH